MAQVAAKQDGESDEEYGDEGSSDDEDFEFAFDEDLEQADDCDADFEDYGDEEDIIDIEEELAQFGGNWELPACSKAWNWEAWT